MNQEDTPRREFLPRGQIIRRRFVFEASRTQGRRFTNRSFTLNVLPREAVLMKSPEPISQVAFLTPKRIGPATVRNQLRRQMREIYRRHLSQLPPLPTPALPPYQIWVARPTCRDLDFEQLKESMLELRIKAGRIPNR